MNTTTSLPVILSMSTTKSPFPNARFNAKDWDEVRMAFGSSILVDTSLCSLAQNLEGLDWPLKGPEEIPAKYIDLSYAEMRESLALRGQSPRVADYLIGILKETLAFDEPFGDMVTQSEQSAARENPVVKTLAKLKIPAEFPVALSALSPETLLFCRLENIVTLGEFALMAQRMAGSVIVGGDFRALLNALSNVDEKTLARYLPFRPGATGLHFIEGVAQAVCSQPVAVQAALAKRLKQPLPPAAADLAGGVSAEQVTSARDALARHADSLRAFCEEDHAELLWQLSGGANPRQLVSILRDPIIEAVVADLIAPPVKQNTGLFSRLMSWWRK